MSRIIISLQLVCFSKLHFLTKRGNGSCWLVSSQCGFLGLVLCLFHQPSVEDIDGCESFQPNYDGALLHHHYQTFKLPGSIYCLRACDDDIRCQSINHVVHGETCELNNRKKEARPKDFTTDDTKVYMKKFRKRSR